MENIRDISAHMVVRDDDGRVRLPPYFWDDIRNDREGRPYLNSLVPYFISTPEGIGSVHKWIPLEQAEGKFMYRELGCKARFLFDFIQDKAKAAFNVQNQMNLNRNGYGLFPWLLFKGLTGYCIETGHKKCSKCIFRNKNTNMRHIARAMTLPGLRYLSKTQANLQFVLGSWGDALWGGDIDAFLLRKENDNSTLNLYPFKVALANKFDIKHYGERDKLFTAKSYTYAGFSYGKLVTDLVAWSPATLFTKPEHFSWSEGIYYGDPCTVIPQVDFKGILDFNKEIVNDNNINHEIEPICQAIEALVIKR